MVNQESQRITVLSDHRERGSTCPNHVGPRITNRESPFRRVAPLPSECYDLVFHDPC